MKESPQKKENELKSQLEPGEQVESVAAFSCAAEIGGFLGLSLAALLIGRLHGFPVPLAMLLNLLPMIFMAEAAQVLFRVQNSCVLVTDRRTFGIAAGKTFSLPHHCLIRVTSGRTMFLDGGEARSSVVLRHLANHRQIYSTISRCVRKP